MQYVKLPTRNYKTKDVTAYEAEIYKEHDKEDEWKKDIEDDVDIDAIYVPTDLFVPLKDLKRCQFRAGSYFSDEIESLNSGIMTATLIYFRDGSTVTIDMTVNKFINKMISLGLFTPEPKKEVE